MKNSIIIPLVMALIALGMSCGDFLHDTPASYIELEVTNFPDGTYVWTGSFANSAWDTESREFTVDGGSGSYSGDNELITSGAIQFSIVEPGSWNRPWYEAGVLESNEADGGDGNRNFVMDIPMDGATHVIGLDASTNPITMTVDGSEVDNTQGDIYD